MKFTVVIAALAFVIQGSFALNGHGTEPPLPKDVLSPRMWPRPWEHRSWEEPWRRPWLQPVPRPWLRREHVPLPVQRLSGYRGPGADVFGAWRRNGWLHRFLPPIAFPPWAPWPRF